MARGGRAGVEVEGGKELRRAFDRMEDRAGDLRDLHKDAASIVEREAESIVPVLTGRLRDSIRTTAGKTSAAVLAGRRLIPTRVLFTLAGASTTSNRNRSCMTRWIVAGMR
jgi:hypothetical protein